MISYVIYSNILLTSIIVGISGFMLRRDNGVSYIG